MVRDCKQPDQKDVVAHSVCICTVKFVQCTLSFQQASRETRCLDGCDVHVFKSCVKVNAFVLFNLKNKRCALTYTTCVHVNPSRLNLTEQMEHFLYLLITHPFGKDPTESAFKGKKWESDWTNLPWIAKRTDQIVYCQLNQVASAHEVILDANHPLHGELHFFQKNSCQSQSGAEKPSVPFFVLPLMQKCLFRRSSCY